MLKNTGSIVCCCCCRCSRATTSCILMWRGTATPDFPSVVAAPNVDLVTTTTELYEDRGVRGQKAETRNLNASLYSSRPRVGRWLHFFLFFADQKLTRSARKIMKSSSLAHSSASSRRCRQRRGTNRR
jgi:hypothetical protein